MRPNPEGQFVAFNAGIEPAMQQRGALFNGHREAGPQICPAVGFPGQQRGSRGEFDGLGCESRVQVGSLSEENEPDNAMTSAHEMYSADVHAPTNPHRLQGLTVPNQNAVKINHLRSCPTR